MAEPVEKGIAGGRAPLEVKLHIPRLAVPHPAHKTKTLRLKAR